MCVVVLGDAIGVIVRGDISAVNVSDLRTYSCEIILIAYECGMERLVHSLRSYSDRHR
jgi:hypothetical protein